jgi:hypothetical protein
MLSFTDAEYAQLEKAAGDQPVASYRHIQRWLIVAAIMLILAIPPIWPYGYYMLLRVVVCGVSVGAIIILRQSQGSLLVAFIVTALLFNPVFPAHLSKELWAPIDLGVAGLFIVVSRRLSRLSPPTSNGMTERGSGEDEA